MWKGVEMSTLVFESLDADDPLHPSLELREFSSSCTPELCPKTKKKTSHDTDYSNSIRGYEVCLSTIYNEIQINTIIINSLTRRKFSVNNDDRVKQQH